MTKRVTNLPAAIRLVCALALMMIGFAHQPVVAQPLSLQYAAYILPDGALPTLCLNDTGVQPSKGGMVRDHGCDACRLSASILTPEPPSLGAQAIAFSMIARTVERQYRLARAPYPPSSGPRAPPSSMIIA